MSPLTHFRAARRQLAHQPVPAVSWSATAVFAQGARWLHGQLQLLRPYPRLPPVAAGQFTRYGWLKYGLAALGAGLGLLAASWWGGGYLPAMVLGFYLGEVQLLFLFPLLLEGVPQPLGASVRLTRRVGVGLCLIVVLPLAAYMMLGLLRVRRPWLHWYVGCLTILRWYVAETTMPEHRPGAGA